MRLIFKKTKMSYLFTSESVSEGHPDKVADQISDAVLDAFLNYDPQAKVACETFVTTGLVVVGGESSATSRRKPKLMFKKLHETLSIKLVTTSRSTNSIINLAVS